MSITHDHTLNPITALEFYSSSTGTVLLAGEGSFLKIFETKTSKLLCQCQVFREQAVHGIVASENCRGEDALQVVIWGGNCLTLLTGKEFEKLPGLESLGGFRDEVSYPDSQYDVATTSISDKAIPVSDWILDTAIADHEDASCVLVTAHNKLLRAKLGKSGQPPVVENLPSPSESILYSAHLVWDTPEQILVAAGTVFGEIIVWQCSLLQDVSSSVVQTLFTFTGHEGSIFGVTISPALTGPNNTITRLVASCSDDRTIRVWDLSRSTDQKLENGAVVVRETGFGEKEAYDGKDSDRCLALVMGHISRIWHVEFLVDNSHNLEPSTVSILSFGEDATTQQWALDFGTDFNALPKKEPKKKAPASNRKATLSHVKTFSFHDGKHIWSTALKSGGFGAYNLATGGADGKISLYGVNASRGVTPGGKLSDSTANETINTFQTTQNLDLDEVLENLPKLNHDVPPTDPQPAPTSTDTKPPKKQKPKKISKDVFNRYAFISENFFLATTTFGRVLRCQIGEPLIWDEIFVPALGKDDLRSYAVIAGFPEIGLAFIAGANGKLYAYDGNNELSHLESVEGKVADMFKVSDTDSGYLSLLVTSLGNSIATLVSVVSARGRLEESLGSLESKPCTLPPGFIVTSAGICNKLLVLGSRKGSLAIYDLQKLQEPLCIYDDADCSNGDSVTTILPIPNLHILDQRPVLGPSLSNNAYFLTTGRNGMYTIYRLTTTSTSIQAITLHPVHRASPPFGPIIEKAWLTPTSLLLSGFKSKNYIIYNLTHNLEIMTIECGGAHRSYDYSPIQNGSGSGHFIYTKASQLYITTQSQPSHRIIKSGGHGREIKCVAVSDDGFIATGSEDTTIRIWKYENMQIKLLAILQSHTAGIQHLTWHSNYLFSSSGNEEFFIWSTHSFSPGISKNYGIIGLLPEASNPDQSPTRDLRITSFDIMHLRSGRFLISLAYSDSTIRVYAYGKEMSFELLAKGRYTSSCLTQILHLQLEKEALHIITASTDGHLCIWLCSLPSSPALHKQTLTLLTTTPIHQNAIKTLQQSPLPLNKNNLIIITTGDDNAISLTIYNTRNYSITPKRFIIKSAHAAAITGLCTLPSTATYKHNDKHSKFRIITSGNDQRVKEWDICVQETSNNGYQVSIQKVGDVFTSIADVGDLDVLTEGKVVLVGNGMEVWNVSQEPYCRMFC